MSTTNESLKSLLFEVTGYFRVYQTELDEDGTNHPIEVQNPLNPSSPPPDSIY
jgi:hypothetical protein